MTGFDEQAWGTLLTDAGVGWVLDSNCEDLSGFTARLNQELDEVQSALDAKLRNQAPNIREMLQKRQEDLRAVIQSFASPMTAEIRAAATLAALGHTVQSLRYDYGFKVHFRLEIEIKLEDGTVASFSSNEIWDGEAVRHFGLMKVGDFPVLHGYLSFRS